MSQKVTLNSTTIGDFSDLIELELCFSERKWWCFVLSSMLTWVACLVITLLWRYFGFLCCRKDFKGTFIAKATDWARELTSVQTTTGFSLMVIALTLNIGSFIVYVIDTSTKRIETCVPFEENITQQIDLFFNVLFLFYFFIRFMAASDKFWFFHELNTLVDFSTIPPAFISLYLGRTWLGFRSLRMLLLLSIFEILHHSNVPKTPKSVCWIGIMTDIIRIVAAYLIVSLGVAGIIHLLENSGDPMDFDNAQSLSYWECIPMAFILGYGFLDCETVLGWVFLVYYNIIIILIFLEITGLRQLLTQKKLNIELETETETKPKEYILEVD